MNLDESDSDYCDLFLNSHITSVYGSKESKLEISKYIIKVLDELRINYTLNKNYVNWLNKKTTVDHSYVFSVFYFLGTYNNIIIQVFIILLSTVL